MNFKLKALVAAAMMAAAVPAFAAMQDATSGNGELLVNFRYYSTTVAGNDAGGDDMSAVFDLGVTMDGFLANNGVAGYTQTWSLTAANYGTAWSDLLSFAAVDANIEFNVIALDNTGGSSAAGASRFMTTLDVATFTLTNGNLVGMDVMNPYVVNNNSMGTHTTVTNGASTAVSGGAPNTYFGSINGTGDGDTWAGKLSDSTKNLATAQNFWFLSNSSTSGTAQATKTAFGVDLNSNGVIGTGEFGEWSVDLVAGTITYANPAPVPEASTYGMMLAGLGLVGFMARRRKFI